MILVLLDFQLMINFLFTFFLMVQILILKFIENLRFIAEDKSQEDSVPPKSSQEHQANDTNSERLENVSIEGDLHGTFTNNLADGNSPDDVTVLDGEFLGEVESVKQLFVKRSENYSIPQLERLYTRIMKGVFETKNKGVSGDLKSSVLKFLLNFVEDDANF